MELIDAVRDNNLDLVNQLLLNPNIDLKATDNDGDTALMIAAGRGNVEIGRRLIESGADVNNGNPRINETPLMTAALAVKRDFVVFLLEQDGIEVNTVSTLSGNTALILAVLRTYGALRQEKPVILDIIEMLLGSGADPNVITLDSYTALSLSIEYDDIAVARLLVENGADINQPMPGRNDQTALTHAVLVQNSRIFNYLLTLPGLDLDAVTDDGRTALMLAVQTSRDARRVVSQLIAAGADPLVISLEGKTARRYSQDSIVSKLLQDAENIWLKTEAEANRNLQQKFMISRRLRTNQTVQQKEIGDNIMQRSEYDNLCFGLQSNLTKPGVVALAKSLAINTTRQTKTQLCNDIASKLIL